MTKSVNIPGTKEKISDLAFYAFNQKGYKAVSMDLVASELRISKKTIYKHFDSKEAILEKNLEELFSKTEKSLLRISNSAFSHPTLVSFYHIYRDFLAGISPVLREEIRLTLPYLEERIVGFESQVIEKTLSQLLKKARKQKEIEYPSPTKSISTAFLHIMSGMEGVQDVTMDFLFACLLKGFAAKKKKDKKSS